MTVCEEFDLRIKNEAVVGTCKWMNEQKELRHWKEIEVLESHANGLRHDLFTTKQNLIYCLVLAKNVRIINIEELNIDLPSLDEEDIGELITFYDLKNHSQSYNNIRGAIAAPTNYLTRIPYSVLCELHKRGKVPFDRQIFAACLIRFNSWNSVAYTNGLAADKKEKFHALFPKDDFALDILMAAFEMEIGANGGYYLEKVFNIGAIIIELVNSGRIARAVIQQKLFDAFNNPTLKKTTHAWVKNIYRDLKFGAEENMACQEQLLQLMYNDRSLVINFGLLQLKKLATNKAFNWSLFINSLDGIVYTEKLTGGLKTALGMLYKKIKKDASLLELSCINLAPIFLQEDHGIQMAAKECFELLETPNEAVREALLPFIDTMHAEVKATLGDLLGNETADTSSGHEFYVQGHYTPAPCSDEHKIAYIASEDDFIFLLSKVVKSNDAIDYELFLESILRYAYLKDTEPKTLKPALKQAERIAFEEHLDITARVGVHHIMAAKLICLWLSPTPNTIEMEIAERTETAKQDEGYTYRSNKWNAILNQFKRISFLVNELHKKESFPLLSTPTHDDFQIDVATFMERLNVYRINKKPIDEGDFCLALARLNRWSLVDRVNLKAESEYDEIVNYLLDDQTTFDHKAIKELNGCWLTAYALKNPDKAIDALIANKNNEKWWDTSTPWEWKLTKKNDPNGNPNWPTLYISYEQNNEPYAYSSENSHFEHHLTNINFMIADMDHWFMRDKYLQEPLFLTIVFNTFRYFRLEADESKTLLEAVKHCATHPVPLGKAGYLTLSLSLFCSVTTIRTAAFDWLSQLIENKNIDLDLFLYAMSNMIISEYHLIPITRVAEQFDRLFQMQGVYLDVLHKTIEASLRLVDPTDIPKSFGKILHHYYEVLQVVNIAIPKDIVAILERLIDTNSVKKEVKKLLGA